MTCQSQRGENPRNLRACNQCTSNPNINIKQSAMNVIFLNFAKPLASISPQTFNLETKNCGCELQMDRKLYTHRKLASGQYTMGSSK